jgi:hypothetical protein
MGNRLSRAGWTLVLCGTLIACESETVGNDDETSPVNVTGTWRGSITGSTTEGTGAFSVIFQLTQSGSNVTGTADSDPHQQNTTAGAFTGTVSGRTLTGHAFGSSSPFDDCGNYAFDFVAEVNGGTMTVKSGSGYDCEGNSVGGHSKLLPLTVTGGTLTRQ